MRRRSIIDMILANGLSPSIAFAQGVSIQSPADVAGNWVLESTALTLTGKRNIEGFKWVFGADGSLARTSLYKFSESLTGGGQEGTIEETFQVKDGKIVTATGDTYSVVERKPDAMTLKGPFGYYFLKRDKKE
jgi:hypothetical protein